uniref:Uncharacterized protein n=1 Tax=Oryza nivara TaxID=4536 RepID=A0A0E0IQS8_ORYNI
MEKIDTTTTMRRCLLLSHAPLPYAVVCHLQQDGRGSEEKEETEGGKRWEGGTNREGTCSPSPLTVDAPLSPTDFTHNPPLEDAAATNLRPCSLPLARSGKNNVEEFHNGITRILVINIRLSNPCEVCVQGDLLDWCKSNKLGNSRSHMYRISDQLLLNELQSIIAPICP